jgi:hypothetical protein
MAALEPECGVLQAVGPDRGASSGARLAPRSSHLILSYGRRRLRVLFELVDPCATINNGRDRCLGRYERYSGAR